MLNKTVDFQMLLNPTPSLKGDGRYNLTIPEGVANSLPLFLFDAKVLSLKSNSWHINKYLLDEESE